MILKSNAFVSVTAAYRCNWLLKIAKQLFAYLSTVKMFKLQEPLENGNLISMAKRRENKKKNQR